MIRNLQNFDTGQSSWTAYGVHVHHLLPFFMLENDMILLVWDPDVVVLSNHKRKTEPLIGENNAWNSSRGSL